MLALTLLGAAAGAGAGTTATHNVVAAAGVFMGAGAVQTPTGAIQVIIVGLQESAQRLRDALVEPLARAGLVVHFDLRPIADTGTVLDSATTATPGVAVRAVILMDDASPSGQSAGGTAGRTAHLHFVDVRTRRQLTREVPLDQVDQEIAFEEIAHMVAASLRTLLDGADREPPPALVAPAPPAAIPARAAILAAAAIGAESWGPRAPAVPAVALSAGARPPGSRLQLWMAAEYRQLRPAFTPVTMTLRVPSLATVVATTFTAGRSLHFVIGAGLGIALVRATTELASGGPTGAVILDPAQSRLAPFARATSRVDWMIATRFALFASLTCDASVMNGRYLLQRGGVDEVLFQPNRVRPSLSVGISMRVDRGD